MSSSPSVSVLVTVYNREAYLKATLRSILNSTYEDFELIVVDDCSKDQSADIARQVAAEDQRIRFVQNEANLGDYGNRMKAASLANAPLLKYVDSDDLIYSHTLQVMVSAMESHPDAAVGLSHSMPEDQEPYPWQLNPQDVYRKHFLDRGCLSCGPTGAIIRKSAFDLVGGFRREWGVLSDTDLWLRLSTDQSVLLLPPGLVWWRRHEDQEFTKGDANDVYLEKGFDLAMQSLTSSHCPLAPELQQRALSRVRQHFARKVLALAIRGRRPWYSVNALCSASARRRTKRCTTRRCSVCAPTRFTSSLAR